MLVSSTHPRWFAVATANLGGLLADHLHCERKAAENALSLVRRYGTDDVTAMALGRLAHEETSHVIQVAELLAERGLPHRADYANPYPRGLFALVRNTEPERRIDSMLVAALIEERSHERLRLLERGFAAAGEARLSGFYRALANAEDRHAQIFVELAERAGPRDVVATRLAELATQEAAIIAAIPFGPRVH
ncbi:MAG TPA: tRNA isopentenyl-2-thiomethyl-A-37 hydroxylase MiaE [Polyangia bacterium]